MCHQRVAVAGGEHASPFTCHHCTRAYNHTEPHHTEISALLFGDKGWPVVWSPCWPSVASWITQKLLPRYFLLLLPPYIYIYSWRGQSIWHILDFDGSFLKLGPEPVFGWLGLGGSSGGYSYHGYTSHASLRAYGAQLSMDRLFFKRLIKVPRGPLWSKTVSNRVPKGALSGPKP